MITSSKATKKKATKKDINKLYLVKGSGGWFTYASFREMVDEWAVDTLFYESENASMSGIKPYALGKVFEVDLKAQTVTERTMHFGLKEIN